MKRTAIYLAVAAIGWSPAFVHPAHASLIGSEIGIFLSIPFAGSFSESTTTTVAADASDAINLTGDFGVDFLFDPYDSGVVVTNVGASWNFTSAQIVLSDLIWAGQPGEVVGVDFTQNDLDRINATSSFTSDSATIDFSPVTGQSDWQTGGTMMIILETTHVPEPSALALAVLALLSLAIRQRRCV